LIALKTILKEIDPYAFEEALKMAPAARKQYAVQQDEKERILYDGKWEKLNSKIKAGNATYDAPGFPFKPESLICDFNPLYKKIYDKEKFVNM